MLSVVNAPSETQGAVVLSGPAAPYQVAAKVGQGFPLAVAKIILGVVFTDPADGDDLAIASTGWARIVLGNVEVGDTITIDGTEIYDFGPEIGEVDIGATAAETAVNLATAINDAAGSVVAYAHKQTVYLEAAVAGVAGDAITVATSAAARITLSAATLAGGADAEA